MIIFDIIGNLCNVYDTNQNMRMSSVYDVVFILLFFIIRPILPRPEFVFLPIAEKMDLYRKKGGILTRNHER